MTTHRNSTGQQEKRRHFRISPPLYMVKELALWMRPACTDRVLPLEDLGMPDTFNINGSGTTNIENISGGGMCFSLDSTDCNALNRLNARHSYVYLKLRRPQPGKMSLRCLFFGVKLLRASRAGSRVHVHCQIISRGMPAAASKSFQIFNVERAGIRDLVVWCEELDRMGRGIMPPMAAGLDIEYLLLELAVNHASKADDLQPQVCTASIL